VAADARAFREAVYAVTSLVPRGQVATYGQIATYVAAPRHARAVGTALRLLDPARAEVVPWQRIVNAAGRISARGDVERPRRQAELLLEEGVPLGADGLIPLALCQWAGPGPGWVQPFEVARRGPR
jgi:methylated-DNA-protein-cysteine methyltransferase-like protein